jgi:hypothetical protein
MSGIEYIVDTNCFIYLLSEHPEILPFTDSRWLFSYITEIELLSKKELTTTESKIIRQMLGTCTKYGHTQSISELTINLRRKYSIKIPDAIIAATSIEMKIPLLTADKGFAQIKEIDCFILEF